MKIFDDSDIELGLVGRFYELIFLQSLTLSLLKVGNAILAVIINPCAEEMKIASSGIFRWSPDVGMDEITN
jgi:hypothetical protein